MGQQVCVYMVPRWNSRCVFTLTSQNLHLMYRFYGKLKRHNSLYLSSLRNALPIGFALTACIYMYCIKSSPFCSCLCAVYAVHDIQY